MLSLSRRLVHRPAIRLFLLGVVAVWLASSFSFVCTRPLLHQAHQALPECPMAAQHANGAGHDMPAGNGCADQPCLDEVQSADKTWSKPGALPMLVLVAIVWLWRVAPANIFLVGRPRFRPPDPPSVPLFHLFCVLRN
ncbi:MAG TPA: hypothetical protein VI457_05080 [Methylococcaceae bacterium]|nr:hypothetical protein [Methylococcaceae bacterium]